MSETNETVPDHRWITLMVIASRWGGNERPYIQWCERCGGFRRFDKDGSVETSRAPLVVEGQVGISRCLPPITVQR